MTPRVENKFHMKEAFKIGRRRYTKNPRKKCHVTTTTKSVRAALEDTFVKFDDDFYNQTFIDDRGEETKFITGKQFKRLLNKKKQVESVIIIPPHVIQEEMRKNKKIQKIETKKNIWSHISNQRKNNDFQQRIGNRSMITRQ